MTSVYLYPFGLNSGFVIKQDHATSFNKLFVSTLQYRLEILSPGIKSLVAKWMNFRRELFAFGWLKKNNRLLLPENIYRSRVHEDRLTGFVNNVGNSFATAKNSKNNPDLSPMIPHEVSRGNKRNDKGKHIKKSNVAPKALNNLHGNGRRFHEGILPQTQKRKGAEQ